MQLELLLSFLGASVLLTMMPGPDIVFVLLQSISFGKKEGILTALGLVLGILVHTSLVAFGVSAIIQQSEHLFFLIKIFGALYLLYLAYQIYMSKSVLVLENTGVLASKKGTFSLVRKGFIMNVLNPKVTLFFLAFFPGFLFSKDMSTVLQFYILGGIFMVQAMFLFTIISVFAGRFAVFFKENDQFQKRIKWIQIVVFTTMAIFLIFEG